jgi:hypothetical protein
MLNFDLFQSAIGELKALSLAGAPDGPAGVTALYKHVNSIPDDVFLQIVDEAAKNLEFFPKPKWFREAAMDRRRPERQKALPFAESIDGVTACQPYVRKYMQVEYEEGQRLWEGLKKARVLATSKVSANGRKVGAAQWALIEASPEVKAASDLLSAHWAKGLHGQGFETHTKKWGLSMAASEMATLREAMTPEEEISYSYEFSIETAITMPSFPRIEDESPKPAPVIEKIGFSMEVDPSVSVPGFEVGDEIECTYPGWYSEADRKETESHYPWGEYGVIQGFRKDVSRVGNRVNLIAIVDFKSCGLTRLRDGMLKHTNTVDF